MSWIAVHSVLQRANRAASTPAPTDAAAATRIFSLASSFTVRILAHRSLGIGLDEKASKQWLFKPAHKDGEPVAATATIEGEFSAMTWLLS